MCILYTGGTKTVRYALPAACSQGSLTGVREKRQLHHKAECNQCHARGASKVPQKHSLWGGDWPGHGV